MSHGITANQLEEGVVSILRTTTLLTNSQIKVLPGGVDGEGFTQLRAAPGAGKAYRMIGMQLISEFVTAYGNVSSNVQFQGAVGSGVEQSGYQLQTLGVRDVAGIHLPITSLLTDTTRQTVYMAERFSVEDVGGGNFIGNVTSQPLSLIENKPLVLCCFNADGNFTLGHADNVLHVTAFYFISNV